MTTKIPVTLLDTTDPYPAGDGSSLTHLLPFLHVREEQPSGTPGGASVATTWQQRVLNTVKTNEITGASLASNQITLPAGTYYVEASTPSFNSGRTKAGIRNVTDSTTALVGESAYGNNAYPGACMSRACGRITLSAQKVIQVVTYTEVAQATDGLGVATISGEVEVYAEVKIWKIA